MSHRGRPSSLAWVFVHRTQIILQLAKGELEERWDSRKGSEPPQELRDPLSASSTCLDQARHIFKTL